VALALLWELYGEAALEMTELSPMRSFRAEERRVLGQMLAQGVRSPVTTSMGRLFDGVAALCGLEQRVTYEGQAAISLEHAASDSDRDAYALPWLVTPGAPWILDWGPMLEAIVRDVRSGRSAGEVSASMHAALVQAAVEAAARCGEATVALSGGCFQNRLLTERLAPALERSGHRVLLHCQVPPNDGGISLGQAAVAAATL
jgi:hydrogenase maturation protein HypF